MSENDHNDDRNANESSDSELEDPLNSTSGNQRVKTVNKKGDNRAVIDSKSCESDHDSDFVDDDNLRGAKVGSKTPRTCKVIYVRENSARKGKLESPKVQKTPNTKNNLTKSRAAEMPELSIPKINVGGSTKKLGRQQSVKDTATQKAENEKGKENKNGGNVRGKSGITEKGIEEGEREDSSVESSNEDYDQNLIESSDSELEDPFNSKASNKSNSEQKSPQKNVKNNSLNNSKARRGNDGEESDISGDENEVVDKGGRKSLRKSKATVGEKNTDSESNVKKGRLDTTKPNKTPVPKNSSRVLTKTTEPSASSTPKRSGRGTSLKLPVQQKIITQAELHVTTSPSSGEENSDDEATSNGVYHSSDDEPTPDPTVGEIISSSPQRATNDPERSNPAEEFSSESEWEENATFPGINIRI
ncbi:cylicin-2-like [Saccostrea cucullata]|uniref:cylicin-2-like n=1 Tax=Saccostrea cuccullata TaxID=36930 RepID=UPI002ED291DD